MMPARAASPLATAHGYEPTVPLFTKPGVCPELAAVEVDEAKVEVPVAAEVVKVEVATPEAVEVIKLEVATPEAVVDAAVVV